MKHLTVCAKMKLFRRSTAMLALAGLAGLLLAASAGAAPESATLPALVAAHADDFNSGSPAAKNIWDGLAAAVNAGDDAATQLALEQLRNVDDLGANQVQVIAQIEAALKSRQAGPAARAAQNTALVPVPRDFPTNWLARHAENLAVARRGGVDVLFLGDSITDGWRWGDHGDKLWARYFAPRHAANFGIGYDRIQNVLWRIENGELDGISPKVIVLLIGTNNTGNDGNTTPEIIEGIANLVARLQARLPQARLILFGVFPRGEKNDPIREQVKAVNAGISKLASDKVKFLDLGEKFLAPDGTLPRDLFPDLLHPNARGYQIWTDALNPVLDEWLK
jgi:lysophospholipase L1-like esterase